jgi:hypothetical protein
LVRRAPVIHSNGGTQPLGPVGAAEEARLHPQSSLYQMSAGSPHTQHPQSYNFSF